MALENVEVLENLRTQLKDVTTQLNTLTETRMRLLGAVEVLQQIEQSKAEEGTVIKFAEMFGPIRTTNFGKHFDVGQCSKSRGEVRHLRTSGLILALRC